MVYIKCSSTFTQTQEIFLHRLAIETQLFSEDDIVKYKRSCRDVAEVQRAVDFLFVCASSGQKLPVLLDSDSRFAHVAAKLRDMIQGE